jgi:hypothetical protein
MFISLFTTITTNINLEEGVVSSTLNKATEEGHGIFNGLANLIQNFNWQVPSWDLFIILFFIFSALIYGMSLGRQRIIVILVSIYMSLAVVDYAPLVENFLKDRGMGDFFLFEVTTFLGAFLILFFLLSRSALLKVFGGGNHDGVWWQVMLFSFLQIGLLISVVLSFLPVSITSNLSPTIQQIFIDETSRFLWIISPILAMIVIRSPKRRRSLRPIDEDY